MKRDMELVRKILLDVESLRSSETESYYTPKLDGYSEEEIHYHCALMEEAGLLDVKHRNIMGTKFPLCYPKRLTWYGHEFLDAARDDGIWTKTVATIKDKTGAMSFDVLLELLKSAILKVASGE
ncbi:DUF2513 domain-containing protein [Nitrospira sp. M1]